jgi:hypothetical protein
VKSASLYLAVLGAAVALAAPAQTAPPAQPPAEAHEHHEEPAPKNLKVLPRTMTGEEVHELMHKWEAQLGAECSTCHAADPTHLGPNGRPRLDFAADSKPEKDTARMMYKMTEQINSQYVSMIENAKPVTCGTCHRGQVKPSVFTPPPGHEHDSHGAPPPASGATPPAE